jgi:holo-[acyl-carrier protein] synthase
MIVGIGTDIVDITRIEKISSKYKKKFAKRILSATEYSIWKTEKYPYRYLAKRFAAKEATFKALGVGLGKVKFQDIEITRRKSGAPVLKLCNQALILQNNLGVDKLHISISDEATYAVATVIFESSV